MDDIEGGRLYDELDYASPTMLEGAGGRVAQLVKGKADSGTSFWVYLYYIFYWFLSGGLGFDRLG